MTTFFTVLLSILLIADCLFLTLLVLVQLPKKDAGAGGMAFGGGAADALFGAGSGNALTKLTKYTAIAFFVLVLILCVLDNNRGSSNHLKNAIESTATETRPVTAPATAAPAPTALPAASSNTGISLTSGSNSPPPATNVPVLTSPATNIPPK